MRVPLSWLRDFVSIEVEPEVLAERLSLTGLAVEQLIRMGGPISGVVVGEVRSMREHPNADNLMLVVASDGAVEHDIVCGARNYTPGDRIPLALVGAKLPNGMEIGARVVRGEASNGMLCSARELGLGDDHSGILLLDADAPVGEDLGAIGELDDIVLDIDVTPNRSDAMSIMGVAREVAAITGARFAVPAVSSPEASGDAPATVDVKDAAGCPRYLAQVVTGITVGRSPWWMRRRLLAAGMRPISNVVDITNYVLLERGQPLHAFDLSHLGERTIVVRKPRKNETLTTLDGEERTLDSDDVLICDAERPVALGGIMGGADSEVSQTTTEILLESAQFAPERIARTSRRLGLRTEASVRFERGVDPDGVAAAATRALELLVAHAGGRPAGTPIDVGKPQRARKPIRLRTARASMLIGAEQTTEQMAQRLRALGCDVTFTKTALRATPPTWRPDLVAEEDLIEEVARLGGYDSVPATLPGGARTGGLTVSQLRRRRARSALLGAGLHEAVTLSLIPPDLADQLDLPPEHVWRRTARLANPLSEDESVLRPALVPGLLLAARSNAAHRVLPVRLFEIGTVFIPTPDGVSEHERAAWVMTGPARTTWHDEDRSLDLFDAKGVLEALMRALGIQDWDVVPADASLEPGHPGRFARITHRNEVVGTIAEVRPDLAQRLDLPDRVAVAELVLAPLLTDAKEARAPAVGRFPATTRDIALVVPETASSSSVRARLREAGGGLLEQVELFDVYRGRSIPQAHVSLAFALTFRAPDRTLTDSEIEETMGRIGQLAGTQGWQIRE